MNLFLLSSLLEQNFWAGAVWNGAHISKDIRYYYRFYSNSQSDKVTNKALERLQGWMYHKVVCSGLSWLVAHLRIFRLFMKGDIWCLCTVIFGKKTSKLNRRLVYCSWFYGNRTHTSKNIIPIVITRAMANSSKNHALLMSRIWKMGWNLFSSLDIRENPLFVLFPA